MSHTEKCETETAAQVKKQVLLSVSPRLLQPFCCRWLAIQRVCLGQAFAPDSGDGLLFASVRSVASRRSRAGMNMHNLHTLMSADNHWGEEGTTATEETCCWTDLSNLVLQSKEIGLKRLSQPKLFDFGVDAEELEVQLNLRPQLSDFSLRHFVFCLNCGASVYSPNLEMPLIDKADVSMNVQVNGPCKLSFFVNSGQFI